MNLLALDRVSMHSSLRHPWLDQPSLHQAAEALRAIAHPVRLRLIQMILQGTYTVGEFAEACGLSGAIVSGHLRLMPQHGLLAGTRDGRHVHYRAVEPILSCIVEWIFNEFGNAASIGCGCCRHQRGAEVLP
jgi:ArsR family transcriptional regulator, zinc-responsive transcriptional repressor